MKKILLSSILLLGLGLVSVAQEKRSASPAKKQAKSTEKSQKVLLVQKDSKFGSMQDVPSAKLPAEAYGTKAQWKAAKKN